ncbi:brnQ [Wigglesworthia glossinidia endosymbiont of Glossina brevipalpis]|uniref:Branched-chain amino acid transport system carrier protein n=1 Tax=Wigglesworthia glossinidia brevipalpis TaxID=36870 RepID=Q8D266_WIGBR|nr:brnQ [Wigglesworthia glossinidia endosymbiont of Glossina brevipalpis]
MFKRISYKNIISISFLLLGFFLGISNIVIPIIVSIKSNNVFLSIIGFLITSVIFPMLVIFSLSKDKKVKKNILGQIIGKKLSFILFALCHIMVGPLFAIPRTSIASFEIVFAPFFGNGVALNIFYNFFYFLFVSVVSYNPKYLLKIIGLILNPIKITILIILCVSSIFISDKYISSIYPEKIFSNFYQFFYGLLHGYLTMDILGSMVFGLMIVKSINLCGVKDKKLITKYIIITGTIVSFILSIIYILLFKVGIISKFIFPDHEDGLILLNKYIKYMFGDFGHIFFSIAIFITCFSTAVSLTCSCAEFLKQYFNIKNIYLVIFISIISSLISNFNLNQLLFIALPVLSIIYPPCITLIISNLILDNNKINFLAILAVLISFFIGFLDSINLTYYSKYIPIFINILPFSDFNMRWVLPTFTILLIGYILKIIKKYKNKNF